MNSFNNISIVVNTTNIENSLDSTRSFGLSLNKTLTIIKMVHWYTQNYNAHKILGDLYESLSDLFDKLQEEIIGTCQQQNKPFPQIFIDLDSDNIQNYIPENQKNMESYYKVNQTICAALKSPEFNSFLESVTSGINNTKEEILSQFNKANYLLNMVEL